MGCITGRIGRAVSYIDASGDRQRRKVTGHTRRQAMDALSLIRTVPRLLGRPQFGIAGGL
jgi:hypothetical protein